MKKQDYELLDYLEGFLTESRVERFKEVLSLRTRYYTVLTEDVIQLHNTSAVIRSCDIFGIQDIHVIDSSESRRIDKEIAMGAQKWVDVYKYDSVDHCIDKLKEQGYQIVATTPHAEGHDLKDFDWTKPSCFCFGKEDIGLSAELINKADTYLKIPMFGFTESLNISVSAAIILQYLTEKLRSSNMNWQLSEAEMDRLRFKWTKKSIKSVDSILERYDKKG